MVDKRKETDIMKHNVTLLLNKFDLIYIIEMCGLMKYEREYLCGLEEDELVDIVNEIMEQGVLTMSNELEKVVCDLVDDLYPTLKIMLVKEIIDNINETISDIMSRN